MHACLAGIAALNVAMSVGWSVGWSATSFKVQSDGYKSFVAFNECNAMWLLDKVVIVFDNMATWTTLMTLKMLMLCETWTTLPTGMALATLTWQHWWCGWCWQHRQRWRFRQNLLDDFADIDDINIIGAIDGDFPLVIATYQALTEFAWQGLVWFWQQQQQLSDM